MKMHWLRLVALALGCTATFVFANPFTWMEESQGLAHEWDDPDNWECLTCGGAEYPDDTNDDATFPSSASEWTVDLVDEAIDDLVIMADTAIGPTSVPDTLTCDSVTISGGNNYETVVIIGDGARIQTN